MSSEYIVSPGNWSMKYYDKSIKYNYIYFNPHDNGLGLFEGAQKYIEYYYQKKYQTIEKKPKEAYQESLGLKDN